MTLLQDQLTRAARKLLVLSLAMLLSFAISAISATMANASPSGAKNTVYARITELVKLPAPFTVLPDGKVEVDKKLWEHDREDDGTELYTSKKADARIATLRSTSGTLESFTSFALGPVPKEKGDRAETDESLSFKDGKLTSRTSCSINEGAGAVGKDAAGRICTTATQALCTAVKNKDVISPDTIKEMDSSEMRALAVILTLRGPDHQLDNVIRYGNRLGLKHAAQTTKGQLILASRQPAAEKPDDVKQFEVAKKSLERLKTICTETGY